MGENALRLTDVQVRFKSGTEGHVPITALEISDWSLAAGSCIGISGPSGAGKSTLLNVVSGLLLPTQGQVCWHGQDLTALSEQQRDRWRRRNVGFIFQNFHLIPELSAFENVLLPHWFNHWRCPLKRKQQAKALLHQVGIEQVHQLAATLSRGQQQRVAAARAMLHDPPVILADEPTASLDPASAIAVMDLLLNTVRANRTLVIVSHDRQLLERLDHVYRLQVGKLTASQTIDSIS
ncbi:MAG: ABC transporter ATP-binding protein [Cyanobacteria bacterium P01_F01_bin.42]